MKEVCFENLYPEDNEMVGVADQEDNGGLIFAKVKVSEGKYIYKLVGLSDIQEDDKYIQGKQSIATDLTTSNVHQWISNTIDKCDETSKIHSKKRRISIEDLPLIPVDQSSFRLN